MALQMKEACETCHAELGWQSAAYICSYECTFCEDCTTGAHTHTCPNCGGELVRRPKRARTAN